MRYIVHVDVIPTVYATATPTDRKRVMESVLHNDSVRGVVYQATRPQALASLRVLWPSVTARDMGALVAPQSPGEIVAAVFGGAS